MLDDLFEAFDVWGKLLDGQLLEAEERLQTVATAEWCTDGVSYFTRLSNAAGYEVARVHYLVCANGTVARWPSFLVVGDVRLLRRGHQSRPD